MVQLLEQARSEIDDAECHMDRLVLVQTVKEQTQQIELHELQILSKNQYIGTLQREVQSKEQKKNGQIASVEKKMGQEIQQLTQKNHRVTQENQSLKAEVEQLRK